VGVGGGSPEPEEVESFHTWKKMKRWASFEKGLFAVGLF
jgi:hypothetical protein